MDFKAFFQSVDNVVDVLAPIAETYGGNVGAAAKLISAASDIVTNVVARVEDGQLAASTDDQATLSALADKLRQENDRLAQVIAAS